MNEKYQLAPIHFPPFFWDVHISRRDAVTNLHGLIDLIDHQTVSVSNQSRMSSPPSITRAACWHNLAISSMKGKYVNVFGVPEWITNFSGNSTHTGSSNFIFNPYD
jgi:hypothetical protein